MNIQPSITNTAIRHTVTKSLSSYKVTAEEARQLEHLRSLIITPPASEEKASSIVA